MVYPDQSIIVCRGGLDGIVGVVCNGSFVDSTGLTGVGFNQTLGMLLCIDKVGSDWLES